MTQIETLAELAFDLDLQRAEHDAAAPESVLRFEWVDTGTIHIDRNFQRRISRAGETRLKRMMAEFDWRKFGALLVVDMGEGRLSCIDGQHRALAAFLLGAKAVPAMVFDADQVGQANAFVGVNVNRTTVASIDKFRARVAAGDEASVTVHNMLQNLEISTDVPAGYALGPKQTRAVGKLERLVKTVEEGIVFTSLEMLLDAQPNQNNLLTAFAIEATALAVVRVVDGKGDIDRLERVLTETDFDTLKENAAQLVKIQGGQTAKRGSEILLQRFNKGLHKPIGGDA